ncbi:hypothetical protein ACJIZ3_003529 [Penstemon smallii]|uniref:Protein yippee-like n=1 Tax=Penstemon smallii TaxID=265156 RepID=A0ABD3U9K5_9LAMI
MVELTATPVYSCRKCRNPIALGVDLISKNYLAKSGQAYMFAHAMNIVIGPKVDKKLMTGYFSIAEIICSKCGEEMGWTYVRAYDAKQKYKEGNYILEKAKILKEY